MYAIVHEPLMTSAVANQWGNTTSPWRLNKVWTACQFPSCSNKISSQMNEFMKYQVVTVYLSILHCSPGEVLLAKLLKELRVISVISSHRTTQNSLYWSEAESECQSVLQSVNQSFNSCMSTFNWLTDQSLVQHMYICAHVITTTEWPHTY